MLFTVARAQSRQRGVTVAVVSKTKPRQTARAPRSPAPSAGVLTFAQLEALWIKAGGSPKLAATMAAIALAESSGRYGPNSVNNNPGTGDYSVGPWQINYYGNLAPDRTKRYGSPATVASNPLLNARAAVDLVGKSGGGLGNWTTYSSGAYRDYLPSAFQAPDFQGTAQDIAFWNHVPLPPNPLLPPGAPGSAWNFIPGVGWVQGKINDASKSVGNAILPDWVSFDNIKRGGVIVGGFALVVVGIIILARRTASAPSVQTVTGAGSDAAQGAARAASRASGEAYLAGRKARGRATAPEPRRRSVRRTGSGDANPMRRDRPRPVSSSSGPSNDIPF